MSADFWAMFAGVPDWMQWPLVLVFIGGCGMAAMLWELSHKLKRMDDDGRCN